MKIHCKKKFVHSHKSILLMNDLLTLCNLHTAPICDDYQACILGKVELILDTAKKIFSTSFKTHARNHLGCSRMLK